MQENTKKRDRKDFILIPMVLTVALTFIGQIGGSIFGYLSYLISGDSSYSMYISTVGISIVTLLYIYFVKRNRPILRALWTEPKGNTAKLLLLGLLTGFTMNMISAAAAILNKDIFLSFDAVKPGVFFLLLAVFVQSSSEELVLRGFLYQRLRKGYKSPAVAIIGNSLLFAAMHLTAPGMSVLPFINIFFIAITMSLAVYYLDSIWFSMGLHTAWNFTQNIILGLPNSGYVIETSVFKLDAASAQNSFAYNVDFGLEGTAVTAIVAIIFSVLIWRIGVKRNEPPLDVWASQG